MEVIPVDPRPGRRRRPDARRACRAAPADPEIEITGQASTGREAVEWACQLAPDVVLMDLRMPGLYGIAATRELSGAAPDTQVLILTTFEQDDYTFRRPPGRGVGLPAQRTGPEQLIAAVQTIAAGDSLLSPSVTRRVIDRMAQQPIPELANHANLDGLTPREREALVLIARACPTARSPPCSS